MKNAQWMVLGAVAAMATAGLVQAQTPAAAPPHVCDTVPFGQLTSFAQTRGDAGYELVSVVARPTKVEPALSGQIVESQLLMCFKRSR